MQGVCQSVTVLGNGNSLRVQLAPGATVTVRGDANHVRYRLVGGTVEAHTDVQGTGDVVGPDAPPLAGVNAPASRPPLMLPSSGSPDSGGSANCRDRDVTIAGQGGSYTLAGGCRSLTVTAEGASVSAEMQPGAAITVPGAHDKVTWFSNLTGPEAAVEVTGQDSTVLRQQRLGSTIAPPDVTAADLAQAGGQGAAPGADGGGPLMVTASGAGGQSEASCHGRDVQVSGDGGRVVLHGPCRTLTVTGSNDKIMAELAPGSRVAISGDNTIVQFALTAAGPDPIVSVDGSHSSAWRVQRLGAESRADASVGVTPTARGMAVEGGAGASVEQVPGVPADRHPQ